MENRTYLWLYLAINSICEAFEGTPRPEDVSIDLLPSSVEDAYEKILTKVKGINKETITHVLQIVVGARRPLSIGELAVSLGVAMSKELTTLAKMKIDSKRLERDISRWCGLFAFVRDSYVYLIHQTAKDFLISTTETEPSLRK